MKKLIFFCVAIMAMTACDNKEPNLIPIIDVIEVYDDTGRNIYHETGVEWRLEMGADGKYTLYMDKTRFIQGMPYLNMEVRNLENQSGSQLSDVGFIYSASEVVPYYNGLLMPNYTLYNFSCDTEEDVLNVRFKCMTYDVRYRGKLR